MAGYIDSEERAQENRSSAWTLLLVGGIGLIVIILGMLNIISLPLSGFNKIMVCSVLGILCLIFIVSGFISIKKSKTYSASASAERDSEKQILAWCKENNIAQKIDETIENQFPNLPEEEVYFKRYEGLSYYVFKNFQSMSLPFLEHVVDEIFDSLFEE